jgi:chromosome segregation protein
VRLKKLIAQGFKSFKDRTVVTFDHGITGIVGPNGCGKSNIVDALFWVMGEQSAKHLRGNSMRDVIFAGASKYSPAPWAEVTLLMENSDGKHIHIGNKVVSPSEIQISRKLYRNGESEYRINGAQCRLKDIQEIFMDTGAGAKSYSIIAQGEIERLVQAKPQERRVMIEEVAGITKFKARKRESLRKMEQTASNLSRLSDLQQEVEKNLKTLELQAQKARRGRKLKERIQRYQLIVSSDQEAKLLKQFDHHQQEVEYLTDTLQQERSEKDRLELDLATERVSRDEQTEQLDLEQKRYNQRSTEHATTAERINAKSKMGESKDEQIDVRQKELKESQEELGSRQIRKNQIVEQRVQLVASATSADDLVQEREHCQKLKEQSEQKEQRVRSLREQIEQLTRQFTTHDSELFKVTNRLNELASSLQDSNQEREDLEREFAGLTAKISGEQSALVDLEQMVEKLQSCQQEQSVLVEQRDGEARSVKEQLQQLREVLMRKESQLTSLKELADSLDGVQEGAAALIRSQHGKKYELLGSMLNCDARFTAAVEASLGHLLELVILRDGDQATQLYDWCNNTENRVLGLDYFVSGESSVSSNESFERLKLAFPPEEFGEIYSLADLIQSGEKDFTSSINTLLADSYIVTNLSLEAVDKLPKTLHFNSIVSLDGSVVVSRERGGRIVTLPSKSSAAPGVVDRNNRIVQLQQELERVTIEIDQLEVSLNSAIKERDGVRHRYQQTKEELVRQQALLSAKRSLQDSQQEASEVNERRLKMLRSRSEDISVERLSNLELEERLTTETKRFKVELDQIQDELTLGQVELDQEQASYRKSHEELLAHEIEAQSFQERLNSLDGQIGDIDQQIEVYCKRMESNQETIGKLQDEVAQGAQEITSMEGANRELAVHLQQEESALQQSTDKLSTLLISMQEREERVKKLSEQIAKNESKNATSEVKLGHIKEDEERLTRDVFEKYRINLRNTLATHLKWDQAMLIQLNCLESLFLQEGAEGQVAIDPAEFDFTERQPHEVKKYQGKLSSARSEFGQLGEINWQAIEEYDRQQLRHKFLKDQEDELKASLADLRQAIDHIDQKSHQRFLQAFAEVNTRFEKVFPVIFGGGQGRLDMVGNIEQDDEFGVDIIASPPGKKMQNINLMSGGEKAMTAVSLIFSIFLVKPSPFCLLDEVDAPLDDANIGRFTELLREMSSKSQFIVITHNKKTMELNDTLYGITMQDPGISKAISIQLQ